jgi:4-hydroxy-tetrahydrodipicolinate reductase
MTRIAITGAAGRMGRVLIEAVHNDEQATVAGAIVLAGDAMVGVDVGAIAGLGKTLDVIAVTSVEAAIDDFDVLIDFTSPEATMANVALCQKHGKGIVIGTTGLTDLQKIELKAAASSTRIVFAPNYSVGVNLCLNLLRMAASVMGRISGRGNQFAAFYIAKNAF